MKTITPQKALDLNWQHFVVNKNPQCKYGDGDCSYFYENNRCSIGICLELDDAKKLEQYVFEHHNPFGNLKNHAVIIELNNFGYDFENLDFMIELQKIHDTYDEEYNGENFNEYMKEQLIQLAKEYNLEIPEE